MTQINLLPWREKKTREQKIQFLIFLGLSVLVGLLIVLAVHIGYAVKIRNQNSRNKYLQAVIDLKSGRLTTVNRQKKEMESIKGELAALESYKTSSYAVIRVLDSIPRLIPDEVTLSQLNIEKNKLTLSGMSTASAQVSAFATGLQKSGIYNDPELTEISAKNSRTGEDKYFQIVASIKELHHGPA